MMTKRKALQILIPAIFVTLIIMFYVFGGNKLLSLEKFQETRGGVTNYYHNNAPLFVVLFFLAYFLSTALSLPAAVILTIAGAAIMGWLTSLVVVVLAASLGSVPPFLVARYLFHDVLNARFSKTVKRINDGVNDSGWWYLLSARLSAVIPFYAINLASGLTDIKLRSYFSATFFGIIPGTLAFTFAGSQIGSATKTGSIISPRVIISLLVIALVPLLIRYFQKRLLASKLKP